LVASGISEEVTEENVLLRECIELMEIPKPTKTRSSLEGLGVKDLALKRLREKPAIQKKAHMIECMIKNQRHCGA
jgi:hypothetical protein